MSRSIRSTLLILLAFIVVVFGLVVGRQLLLVGNEETTPAPDLSAMNVYVYEQSRDIAPFNLLDEQGQAFTSDDLKGHWTFAFVGFTNCPDICPAAMANLRRTNSLLPAEMPEPEFLLISADPERDTPEKLDDYVSFFGDSFHGVTGDLEGLRALAKSLSAVIVHRDADGGTLVDHSAHYALIDPDGKLAALFQPPHEPEEIAAAFREIYEWARENHPRAAQSS